MTAPRLGFRAHFVSVAMLALGVGLEAAHAQSPTARYSLFNPTPDSALREFSPERPGKAYAPTTVDAGRLNLETELVNYSIQRTDGVRTEIWTAPAPTLRLGLTHNTEFQASFAPYLSVRTRDVAAGLTEHFDGPGDLFLRAKLNAWGNDGGTTALGIMPWVKLATAADGIGNGATEWGLIVPISASLGNDITLTFNTEIDRVLNDSGSGYHNQYVHVLALSGPIAKGLTLSGEIWSQVNADPSGTVHQLSFDTALAWGFRPNMQLDVGVNIGLNDETPAFQGFVGLAQRF